MIKQAFRQFQYPTVPLHADMSIKEQALARVHPPDTSLWLPNTPYGQAVRVVRLAVRHPGRR